MFNDIVNGLMSSGGFMETSRYISQAVPSYRGAAGSVSRSVPVRVILSVIFNNIFGYMGLSFGSLGMIFAAVFMPMADLVSPFHFGSDALKVPGTVTEVKRTNVSVNEETVIEYSYVFSYMGTSYKGRSYSTGHSYRPDQTVTVEVEPDNPGISRIENMSVRPVGIWVLFILIFPLIGFVFLYFAFKKGIPKIRTLRHGIMTRGKFVKSEGTGGSINGQTIYDLYFSFKDLSGIERTAIGSTHKTGPVLDEPEERILYDPADPTGAVVVDAMPASVRRFLSSVPG